MGHKGGPWEAHEECIVRTAVCQKTHLGTKQRQTVKKIKPIALAVIELRRHRAVSQSVSRKFH